MIKFYDPSGESHFGQATITRTTSVNGGLSLTGEVFAGDDVLTSLDYGWWLNFDNEKYVITYKKLSDDTNTIVFDAVQQFFWDFAKVALHSQYTGSHEYTFYLNQLFNGSEYTYNNDATVPAFEKENWGYKNKLSLFNDVINQAGVEFEVHNETVHIAKQIGSDLTSFVRKGINLSDLTEEMKISDFATYAKGYGAFKDPDDHSKGRLEVEYRSELAKKFGDLEMDPIVDERYTVADNLIAALKKQVDATYTVSMNMNIYDLENAGYPNYESPKVGDWILAIDEALNFKRKIRIIKLEEQFDVTGKRIGYTATCGDLNIMDQYTNIQSSLDSRVQRIQESIDSVASSADGKNTNYYGAKEPVSANDGDLWFDQSNSDPDKWSIKQWANGRWEQLTLNPGEVEAKVSVAREAADTATKNANTAVDTANKAVKDAGFATGAASTASQAASSAVAAANEAAVGVTAAKSDAANALTNATTAFNTANGAKDSAGVAINNAKSALNKVNGLQFGGRNLILNSANLSGFPTWVADGNKPTTTADGSEMTIVTKHGGLNINSANLSKNLPNVGDTVTISVEAKGTATLEFNYQNGNGFVGSQHFTVTDEYKRYFAQYTWDPINVSANQQFVIYTSDSTDTTLIIKNPKLEVGNVATDWTPAPEDVQVQISDINGELQKKVSQDTYDSLAGTVDQVSTLSKQNQSELVTKADSQVVDTIKQRVTKAENTLTQTATKTELQQTKTDVDKLNNTVKSSSSEITAQAGKIDGLLGSTTDINGKLTTLQDKFDLSSKHLSNTMSKVDSMSSGGGTNLIANSANTITINGDKEHYKVLYYNLTPGTWTFSSNAKYTQGSATAVSVLVYDSGHKNAIIPNNTVNIVNGRLTTTFTITDSTAKELLVYAGDNGYVSTAGNILQLDHYQLETGIVAHDWSPAPEDQATATALTKVKQTADSVQVLANDNKGDIAALTATAKGLQTTVSNNYSDLHSQVTQTDSAWRVALSNTGQTNLVYNSNFKNNADGWTATARGYLSEDPAGTYQGSPGWAINKTNTGWIEFGRSKLYKLPVTDVRADNTYSASAVIKPYGDFTDGNALGTTLAYFDANQNRVSGWHDMMVVSSASTRNVWTLVKCEDYKVPANAVYIGLQFQAHNKSGTVHGVINHPMITSGPTIGPYTESTNDLATQADMTVLSKDINLRVKKGDVVNQINVDSSDILIDGKKVHITGETHIDDAVIKSAMIESLKADKIRTGILDADKVNVIHLNAGNITAGVINGPNLKIDLDTGEILFQKGAIKSTNGNLNIDIDSGNMAVTDVNGNGFRFDDGKLFLTSNDWINSYQSKPDYGYIAFRPQFLSNVKGMQIAGTDGIAVTAGNYDASSFLFQRQPNSGAALALHDNTAFLNAREHVSIEGGSMYTTSITTNVTRATIIVGGANGGKNKTPAVYKGGVYNAQEPVGTGPDLYMQGRKITLQGGTDSHVSDFNLGSDGKPRISSAAIYNRTYSSGDKVTITSYGTLGRITSARKYKIADTPALDVIGKAKRVLNIKPAEWYDKTEIESIADAETNGTEAPREAKIEKHYGFIADDFDAAGLNEVVLYKDGEVDSLAYDRIPMYHNVILTDHEKRIAELEEEIKQLKGEI